MCRLSLLRTVFVFVTWYDWHVGVSCNRHIFENVSHKKSNAVFSSNGSFVFCCLLSSFLSHRERKNLVLQLGQKGLARRLDPKQIHVVRQEHRVDVGRLESSALFLAVLDCKNQRFSYYILIFVFLLLNLVLIALVLVLGVHGQAANEEAVHFRFIL